MFRNRTMSRALLLIVAALAPACGESTGSAVDGPVGPDAPVSPLGPSAAAQTSGGGLATSPNYRMRLSIGAPPPVGTSASASFALRVGPGATR
jgi:hypothetical protein